MDRRLVTGALGLLIFQVIFLLGDLGLIPLPFGGESSESKSIVIGHISNKRAQVKRKNLSSIVWQESKANDLLHKNDAVLTLENSAAHLVLSNDVQIDVHENTLVVLETLESSAESDPLRIRFQRGLLNSSTGTQRLKLGSGEWTLDAIPGSNLSVRSLENDQIEVEVMSGKISLQHANDTESSGVITSGERTTLDKENMTQVIRISTDLKFDEKVPKRIYAHHFPYKVPISWHGTAQSIRILHSEHHSQIISVSGQEADLLLMPGTYSLNLENEDQSSKMLILELLPAPRIVYTKPLPRDRLSPPGPHVFSWMPSADIDQYEIQITKIGNSESDAITEDAKYSIKSFSFAPIGAFNWKVYGIDRDGYKVPPLYEIPFYSVKNPLSAPKLNAPAERKPTSQKKRSPQSSIERFWNMILPLSYAQDAETKEVEKQIVFSWYPVDAADHYIIEISSRPDFIKPEVIEKIRGTEFAWKKFKSQNYFWRVAAGTDLGQMGVFSEAEEFDVRKLRDFSPGELTSGVRMESLQVATSVTPTPTLAPEPSPIPAPQQKQLINENAAANPGQWHFALQLHKWVIAQKAGDLQSSFDGTSYPSIFLSYESGGNKSHWFSMLDFSQLKWAPKDESQLPYQNLFSTSVIQFGIMRKSNDWAQGLSFWQFPIIERIDLEKVEAKNTLFYGYQWAHAAALTDHMLWDTNFGSLYADNIIVFFSQNKFHQEIEYTEKKSADFGIRFDIMGYSGGDHQSGYMFRLGIDVGI